MHVEAQEKYHFDGWAHQSRGPEIQQEARLGEAGPPASLNTVELVRVFSYGLPLRWPRDFVFFYDKSGYA